LKALFGLVGLLMTVAIVGLLLKQQLGATRQSVPALQSATPASIEPAASAPAATVREQSQQVQQQYQKALESAMQARPDPDK
jgi:TfoX/Sxy family transcriptional regulator of competence genes